MRDPGAPKYVLNTPYPINFKLRKKNMEQNVNNKAKLMIKLTADVEIRNFE